MLSETKGSCHNCGRLSVPCQLSLAVTAVAASSAVRGGVHHINIICGEIVSLSKTATETMAAVRVQTQGWPVLILIQYLPTELCQSFLFTCRSFSGLELTRITIITQGMISIKIMLSSNPAVMTLVEHDCSRLRGQKLPFAALLGGIGT